MRHLQNNLTPYSKTLARLLRKELESSDKEWDNLLTYQTQIQDYLSVIGLQLVVQKDDGYAFVQQFHIDDEGNTIGLAQRRQIGFEASVICVVLAEMFFEFKESPTEIYTNEKFVKHSDIKERVEYFLKEKMDNIRFLKDIDRAVSKAVDMGFLKIRQKSDNINDQQYIIKKIIQEKFTSEVLSEFNKKLEEHVEHIQLQS